MFLFTFDLTAALSFSFSFQLTIYFVLWLIFRNRILSAKITQIALETFSLCAGIGHASVWYTIASLNFHGILMHSERKKGRHREQERELAGGHQSSLQSFLSSPEFSSPAIQKWLNKTSAKKSNANKESHLLKCSVPCYCSFVLQDPLLHWVCQVTTPHCLVHCNTGNKTLWNAEGEEERNERERNPESKASIIHLPHILLFSCARNLRWIRQLPAAFTEQLKLTVEEVEGAFMGFCFDFCFLRLSKLPWRAWCYFLPLLWPVL